MVAMSAYKICRVNVNGSEGVEKQLCALAKDNWRIVSVAPDINLDYYLVTLERDKGRR